MPIWLKKIVLDIMPSVAATIIGAYVVNYYIIPKSPLGASRAALVSTDSKPADGQVSDDKSPADKAPIDKASLDKASLDKSTFEKAVADKTAIEKTVEKAARDKAVGDKASNAAVTESRKTAKTAAKPVSVAATEPTVSDDRRTTNARATDLARAAIERVRGNGHAEPVKSDSAKLEPAKPDLAKAETLEPVKSPDVPRLQTVSTVATPTIPPMQPLPPAISVASPNSDVFDQGNAAPVMRQPLPQAGLRSDDQRRLSPPASIPVSRPIDLRAEASVSDRTSVADDVMSAAKSMFHAVMPR